MVEVKSVADAEIEPEGVELGDRPESVHIQLRAQDDIALRCGSDENRTRRAEEHCGAVLGEVYIVVILDTHRRAEAELDRAQLEIVGNLIDRLAARFRRGFTGERWPDRILGAGNSGRTKQRQKKGESESAGERKRRSDVTHVGVGPVD